MKESKYNFFIPYNERIICFNGMSGKVFSVKQEEHSAICEHLKNFEKENDISQFLYKYGFIIEEDIDEVESLKLRNRIGVFDSIYQLIINPTLECNFSCWYCLQRHSEGYMREEIVEAIKKHIQQLVDQRVIKGIILSWFGGEPLLYYKEVVYPISRFTKDLMEKNNLTFGSNITTNGYLMTPEVIAGFKEIGIQSAQITIDGDIETHNKTRNCGGSPSFDVIVQNIINLCYGSPDTEVMIRINYTDEIIKKSFEDILGVFPLEVRGHIAVNFHRVWQTSNEITKPNVNNPNLLKAISAVKSMGFKSPRIGVYFEQKSHICYADKYYYAHINYDGKVYKCTARDYSEKYVCGELNPEGEIKWNAGVHENMHNKAHFDNEKCTSCKQLPLCMGPCYQTYLDYKNGGTKDFCTKGTREISTDTFIKEYYLAVKEAHANKVAEQQ